ncbi:MAG: 16S rRNA (adenine(1518)-N(6)/adenine(1519)-N(6))-dimethyltransferase RsmA [Proteobacteria bacterium]|nr:16S rRNA (adenine(1518)-N(6)/adenine(1519)-N(6))-dimethyltransferase RsmA [Pseudomonadota bacterium]
MPNARKGPEELPPLREVIARHGLSARRGFGQHFLLDLNLTARIARAAGTLEGICVIEIGPGPGGLTRALLASDAAAVVAIERDRRCAEALEALADAYPGRLHLVPADALEVDPVALAADKGLTGPFKIVANLPYNIATVLLIRWLRQIEAYQSLTLTFQKEVAERLTASPSTKQYGRLSVMTGWLCKARIMFDIPPRAFVPAPKVTSSVVTLTPLASPLAPAAWEDMERVVKAAFGQRRKMLRAGLKTLVADPLPLLEAAGISPTSRAEELDIPAFCALARAYRAMQ